MYRRLLLVACLSAGTGLLVGRVRASEHAATDTHPAAAAASHVATSAPTRAAPSSRSTSSRTKAATVAPAAAHPTGTATYSPAEVRRRLYEGNVWFTRGGIPVGDVSPTRRESVAPSQAPWCTVLTCADSRVPPEHLFNVGLGEMFTVRVAGNVAEPVTVGSVEYAAEHLHTPLVLVLGHERCGAVKAALQTERLGPNLDALLALIRPGIKGIAELDEAVEANVRAQVAALRKSEILAHLEAEGAVTVIGARYDLDSGVVSFLAGDAQIQPLSPMSPIPFSR